MPTFTLLITSISSEKTSIIVNPRPALSSCSLVVNKGSFAFPSQDRYHQVFEYMFVFSKGKPKTMNFIKDRKNLYVGVRGASGRNKDGERNQGSSEVREEYGKRFNIWNYPIGGGHSSTDRFAYEHPAIFP